MSYAQEKLALAIDSLAASAAPIQQRLASAGLALHTLNVDDFEDSDDRKQFVAIRVALRAVEPRGGRGGSRPAPC